MGRRSGFAAALAPRDGALCHPGLGIPCRPPRGRSIAHWLMAISLGGYYAPRAAAFEPRFAACVAWGAQWDYHATWAERLNRIAAGEALRMYIWDNPPSASIHEEATVSTVTPFMSIYSNLVLYGQHKKLNAEDGIKPELATSWAWDEGKP